MALRIAFIGLGTMGAGMAARLIGAGHAVTVHNRTRSKAEALLNRGAKWADKPGQAAASADVVLAMVADDDASRSMWLGHDGLLSTLRPGTLAIECSTISPAWALELRRAVESESASFLDAPVTGSKPQAEAGELIFMVGGDAEVLERARPVLSAMAKTIVHVGGPGAGARVKLLNNFLAGVQAASLAEALAIMERSGIDPQKAMAVIGTGAPGSPMINSLFKRIASGDQSVYFYLHLMAKDLAYAQQEAERHGFQSRTAGAAFAIFRTAMEHGDGEKDVSGVVHQYLEPRTR